jgi:hypothetical protein
MDAYERFQQLLKHDFSEKKRCQDPTLFGTIVAIGDLP